jgi:hypothetical protein
MLAFISIVLLRSFPSIKSKKFPVQIKKNRLSQTMQLQLTLSAIAVVCLSTASAAPAPPAPEVWSKVPYNSKGYSHHEATSVKSPPPVSYYEPISDDPDEPEPLDKSSAIAFPESASSESAYPAPNSVKSDDEGDWIEVKSKNRNKGYSHSLKTAPPASNPALFSSYYNPISADGQTPGMTFFFNIGI